MKISNIYQVERFSITPDNEAKLIKIYYKWFKIINNYPNAKPGTDLLT